MIDQEIALRPIRTEKLRDERIETGAPYVATPHDR